MYDGGSSQASLSSDLGLITAGTKGAFSESDEEFIGTVRGYTD